MCAIVCLSPLICCVYFFGSRNCSYPLFRMQNILMSCNSVCSPTDGILELGRNKQQRKRADLIILLLLLGNDYVCTYVISLLPSGLIPTLTLGKARRKRLPTPEGIFVKRELKRLMLPKKGERRGGRKITITNSVGGGSIPVTRHNGGRGRGRA